MSRDLSPKENNRQILGYMKSIAFSFIKKKYFYEKKYVKNM